MRAPKRCAKRVDVDRDDRFDLLESEFGKGNDVVDSVEQLETERDRQLVVLQVRRQDDERVAEVDRASF